MCQEVKRLSDLLLHIVAAGAVVLVLGVVLGYEGHFVICLFGREFTADQQLGACVWETETS